MAELRKFVRIFLASPGDLVEERRVAKTVVQEFNSLHGETFGYHVELVGWEDTVSIFGRPQATINLELDRCEYFVGVLWKRWGTPPANGGPFTSGFEEEFRRSLERRRSGGRPEISLFFKDVDPEQLRDPGEQLRRVLDFRSELIARKEILFENFAGLQDFEVKLRRCVTSLVTELWKEDKRADAEPQQAPLVPAEERVTEQTPPELGILDNESFRFARAFLDQVASSPSEDFTDAVSVARFRLIAGLIRGPGNDELLLGVHDCNLIYRAVSSIEITRQEAMRLLSCALSRVQQENVPLWHWVSMFSKPSDDVLDIIAWVGTPDERSGAFKILALLEKEFNESFRRDAILGAFDDASPADLRNSASAYLSVVGREEDLPVLVRELSRNISGTRASVSEAILRIALRQGRTRAIDLLFEHKPEFLSDGTISEIFDGDSSDVTNAVLRAGLTYPNSAVRERCARLLSERSEIEFDLAQSLLSDENPNVRLIALLAQFGEGKAHDLEEARQILSKPSEGAAAFFKKADRRVDPAISEYKKRYWQSKSKPELDLAMSAQSVYQIDATIEHVRRRFRARAKLIRDLIDDRFEDFFKAGLNELVRISGEGSKLVSEFKDIQDFLKRRHINVSIGLICEASDSADLARVRRAVKDAVVDLNPGVVKYLAAHGGWEDVPTIITFVESHLKSKSLFLYALDRDVVDAALALNQISKNRMKELLGMSMPELLRAEIVRRMPDKVFKALPEMTILSLISTDSEAVRKVAAVKCAKTLTKLRCVQLLETHASSKTYYNVVHWLDLCVSMPRAESSAVASKVLAAGGAVES